MGEWLNQQFAKLSFLTGRVGSNPTTSANYRTGGREVQGNGLQIRKTVSSNLTLCSK